MLLTEGRVLKEPEESTAGDIISGASNMFGAFTSAAVAAVDPTMAATAGMAGVLAEETTRNILSRLLGHRDRRRVSAVVQQAQKRLGELQAQGDSIRSDGFWESRGGVPPTGQEVFEAVLLAAQTDPQEHKVPYLGNLFAFIACHPGISDVSAHWLVKTAESLSWAQFELLAIVGRIAEVSVEGVTIGEPALTWDSFALHRELSDLADGERSLITGQMMKTENIGLEFPSTKLADQTFTESGRLLALALGIEDITVPRLDELVGRLRRPMSEEKLP